jgi:hypothetical protein
MITLELEPSILVRDIDFLSMAEKSSRRWRRSGKVVLGFSLG